MNWQRNTVSVTMKERQNHRKRKNIKVHVFQTKDIIFLLSLSCFIFQLPSSYGFKGLMPFPEGKKKLWNSPLIYNWFSIKYIQLPTFSVPYQTYLIFEEPYVRILFFYIFLIWNQYPLAKSCYINTQIIVICVLFSTQKERWNQNIADKQWIFSLITLLLYSSSLSRFVFECWYK